MSFTKQVTTGVEGEYVYYNATVINNTVATGQSTDDPRVYFQDTRIVPLIKDTSKYVVSVDNFTINGGQKNLPLFIPQIEVGTDINKTIYTITWSWQQSTTLIQATVPITWIPENQAKFTVIPTTATPGQLETNYYYLYNYDHWVNLMNNALTTAWRDVKYKAGVAGATFATVCPYFTYSPNTGLFSLHQDAQSAWLPLGTVARGDGAVTNAAQGVSDALAPYIPFGPSTAAGYGTGEFSFTGWNTNLDLLLTNMDTIYFGGTSTPWGTGFNFVASTPSILAPSAVVWSGSQQLFYPENIVNVIPSQDQNTSNVWTLTSPYSNPTTAATPTYISNTQDFISTGSVWCPIASFVLVTSQIPIRLENNASPVVLGASNSGGQTQSSGASQKVLLETPIDAVTADVWRGFIQYKPLTPIYSALDPCHDGLTNLDVAFYWRNRLTNTLIPLENVNSGSVSFRLRFVKK
jgi:hypothetical protein